MNSRLIPVTLLALAASAQAPLPDGVYRIGNGVSPPRLIAKREPQYSEEARRAKVNANVLLSIVVGTDGVPHSVAVMRKAGFGLDEEAVRAIQETYRFEPGQKEGKPVNVYAQIEVNMRLLNKDYDQQRVQLTFSGPTRPELIKGVMPPNPQRLPAHIRVGLTVTPKGEAIDFNVLESTDDKWASQVLRDLRGWRFRGPLEDAKGVFDITAGPYRRPATADPNAALQRNMSLAQPKLFTPAEGTPLENFPRVTKVQWIPVPGAARYKVEWEFLDNGKWSPGLPEGSVVSEGTEASFDFLGPFQGRWRVSAITAAGQLGNPSEWRTFSYTR